jgi:hypothetical protein
VADALRNRVMLSVAAALVVAGGAAYVGTVRAPWADRPAAPATAAEPDADNVQASAARDRMKARVFSQQSPASASAAAQHNAGDRPSEADVTPAGAAGAARTARRALEVALVQRRLTRP